MGREVKRLALDFDWPIDEPWEGYLMPENLYAGQCGTCEGTGYNRDTKLLSDAWYTHTNPFGGNGWEYSLEQVEVDALVKKGRLHEFTHTWISRENPVEPMSKDDIMKLFEVDEKMFNAWLKNKVMTEHENGLYSTHGSIKRTDGYHPTAAEINEWAKTGFGHDTINKFICVEARAKAHGVWGKCPICEGSGELWRNDAHKKAHNEWERHDPPAGKGWQLWETVSEGSPVSPVCKTREDLSLWMQQNGDGNSSGYSKESADAFVDQGWAPSMIIMDGKIMSGVDAAAQFKE